MDDIEPAVDERAGRGMPEHRMPARTTPTWEIELLVSGALFFASLQLPGWIDGGFAWWTPRLDHAMLMIASIIYVFAKTTALALTLTFGVHVLMRGFWAASVGLHSVFPEGVRWERVRAGPIFRRVARETIEPMPRLIDRLDDSASVAFAFGALMIATVAYGALMVVPALLLVVVIERATGWEDAVLLGAGAWIALSTLPMFSAMILDRWRGDRLAPEGWTARWIAAVARFNARISPRFVNSAMAMFTSRLGETRGVMVLLGALYGLMGIVFVQLMVDISDTPFDGYRRLAVAGPQVVEQAHYAEYRAGSELRFSLRPWIDAPVLDGPYLRLFVPYLTRRHEQALGEACPELAADSPDDAGQALEAQAHAAALIDCLVPLLDVRLDGQPLPAADWALATDPHSDLRGLLAMLPRSAIPEGRHVLDIRRVPSRDADPDDPEIRDHIPFWNPPATTPSSPR